MYIISEFDLKRGTDSWIDIYFMNDIELYYSE